MARRRDDIIAREIESRDIRCLLHFTQGSNLPSILQHGILSRTEMHARGIAYAPSDTTRLDEEDGAISVSFPAFNFEMWQGKRARNPQATWVFLLLDPSLLWRRECRFYDANPASSYIKKSWGRQFGSTSSFEQVFRDACPSGMHRGSSYRGHHGIPAYWPTNPDAEIHVLEPIPPEFILHGWVETPELEAELQAFFDQFTNAQRRVCVGSFDQSFSLSPTPPVRPAWGFPNETVPPIYPEIVTAG